MLNNLLNQMADDFNVNYDYMLHEYNHNNMSMILKKNNIMIGILIMDDAYYEKINDFIHFIKFLWIKKEFRHLKLGSQLITNITKLNHLISNNISSIILNVEKNDPVIDFYYKNGFKDFLDNGDYKVIIL